jgi:hypothetical protein
LRLEVAALVLDRLRALGRVEAVSEWEAALADLAGAVGPAA